MPYIKFGVGGVDLSPLHDSMWAVIETFYRIIGDDFVITSTWEGNHLPWSKHYQNKAIDVRLPSDDIKNKTILSSLKAQLGQGYDVLIEKDHFHIEYDPKTKKEA